MNSNYEKCTDQFHCIYLSDPFLHICSSLGPKVPFDSNLIQSAFQYPI